MVKSCFKFAKNLYENSPCYNHKVLLRQPSNLKIFNLNAHIWHVNVANKFKLFFWQPCNKHYFECYYTLKDELFPLKFVVYV